MYSRPNLLRSILKILIAIFLLIQSEAIAQCGVFSIPYENTFPSGSSSLNCWNDSLGTASIRHTNSLSFDHDTAGGTSILISPAIHIVKKAYLNYFWSHRIGSNNVLGAQDSLSVFIKRSTEVNWSTLKRYSAPFQSSPDIFRGNYEDLAIDSAYIGDTIQIKFE
jgi:hypothetical protein